MIRSDQMDRRFIKEIMAEPGGEHLLTCWSCGTCAATCLVRRFNPAFNPRLILHKAGLGLREAVLSSAEIWACSACDACYPRCPQGIHISQVMRAIRNVAIRAGYEAPGPTAQVDANRCSGCGVCASVCPYEAIALVPQAVREQPQKMVAQVNRNLCQACGLCVVACLGSTITLEHVNDIEVLSRMGAGDWLLRADLADEEPRLIALVCQWSIRSERENAQVRAMDDEHLRVVFVPCSGRVNPLFIIEALRLGADGVLLFGCPPGDCHYLSGNYYARRRLTLLRRYLDYLGIEKERILFFWLSGAGVGRFAEVVSQATKTLRRLGPAKRLNMNVNAITTLERLEEIR
ncbi:MAG: hydrogenase iron-sulfur subunit [Chloroflexi bacterium]|nr:hydrogenase iron-sulfur subunit [Chloroflexota bacterium]MBC7315357.1 hydrogenase iron-sulfur subunit [Chloroflexota bacterium]